MKSLKDVIGENISRIIKDSNLTSRDIAKHLNVSEVTLHRWKTGENPPDVGNLEALAKLLAVDPAEFYKSESNVVTLYGNSPLKNYLTIPDEIIIRAQNHGPDSPVWGFIMTAFDEVEAHQAKKNGNGVKKNQA